MIKPRNALQAVLERQARTVVEPPVAEAPGRAGDPLATTAATPTPKFTRPYRTGRKLIAGHFDPKVAKQLKLLAAEKQTSIQAPLEKIIGYIIVNRKISHESSNFTYSIFLTCRTVSIISFQPSPKMSYHKANFFQVWLVTRDRCFKNGA